MYKPKAIPAIRLPKIADLPSDEDVGRCSTQAQKMRGRAVELPWQSPLQSGEMADVDCVLQCTWFKEDDEPTWAFFKGDNGPRETRWKHQTRDMGLISMICQRECLGADADLESKDRLSAGNKRPGDSEPKEAEAAAPAAPSPAGQGFDQGPMPDGMTPFAAFPTGAPVAPFPGFPGSQPGMGMGMPPQPAMGMGMGMQQPGMGMQQPGMGMQQPGMGMQQPGMGMQQPGMGMQQPGMGMQQPGMGMQQPGMGMQQPGMGMQGFQQAAPSQPSFDQGDGANQMGFASVEKKPARTSSMVGDLSNMKPPIVLQSIVGGKMTGLLELKHNEATIEMFVDEGNPVHASAPDCKGEAAIMELLTWEQGKFQFFADERTTERTVVKRLENILMESAPLIDQFRFLNQTGVTLDSYLVRKHQQISEAEFEQRIARGALADLMKQKQFYQILDGQANLFELLRKMPLSKMDWIPCVYNLVVCDLVSALAVPSQGAKSPPIETLGVDRNIITTAMQNMYKPDTGLLNYPCVLYFLEQEFYRWEYTAAPFSLLIFDMCRRTSTGVEALSAASIREAAKRIDTVKRNVDCLSHFESASFLLFMPNTKVAAAAHVARRIADLLRDQSLGGDLDSANLALAFGVAGVPEDCQDLGLLLAAGKQAVGLSKQSGNPVVTFQSAGRS